MARLHIFIDGSWLFKVAGGVLAEKTESRRPVKVDFARLSRTLLTHIKNQKTDCTDLGEQFLITSIFEMPPDIGKWPSSKKGITEEMVERAQTAVIPREIFARSAVESGYKPEGIYRPIFKPWMLHALRNNTYSEKQVDATVVALLVRSAITSASDYHCVMTGDADIIPAIKVAYPEYSRNVFVATTHPDELKAEHRHSSFSYQNFEFSLLPFYLQDHVADFIAGEYAYTCAQCHKVFVRHNAIGPKFRPYCDVCRRART